VLKKNSSLSLRQVEKPTGGRKKKDGYFSGACDEREVTFPGSRDLVPSCCNIFNSAQKGK